MPAINIDALEKRWVQTLEKRSNFASREPGVILVFCVLGAIGILLIALYAYKASMRRKNAA